MGKSRRFEVRQLLEFAGPEVVIDMVLELDREVSRLTKRVEVLGKIADARLASIREWREAAQTVADLFDPLRVAVSPASLVAVAKGAKAANEELRARPAGPRSEAWRPPPISEKARKAREPLPAHVLLAAEDGPPITPAQGHVRRPIARSEAGRETPCDDHRANGPDPHPGCRCAEIDRLCSQPNKPAGRSTSGTDAAPCGGWHCWKTPDGTSWVHARISGTSCSVYRASGGDRPPDPPAQAPLVTCEWLSDPHPKDDGGLLCRSPVAASAPSSPSPPVPGPVLGLCDSQKETPHSEGPDCVNWKPAAHPAHQRAADSDPRVPLAARALGLRPLDPHPYPRSDREAEGGLNRWR